MKDWRRLVLAAEATNWLRLIALNDNFQMGRSWERYVIEMDGAKSEICVDSGGQGVPGQCSMLYCILVERVTAKPTGAAVTVKDVGDVGRSTEGECLL